MNEVRTIDLPEVLDDRGNLSFFENSNQIPFDIARIYWIYDVRGGDQDGGHAYIDLQEVIVALSGAFDVVVHDGKEEKRFTLNRPSTALYIPAMTWRKLVNFSTNALAFVAADAGDEENRHIRDFDYFKKLQHEA